MKLIVLIAIVLVLLLVFAYKNYAKEGILPPHEFAYGAMLKNIDELPDKVNRFLSLEEIDPDKTQIETFAGNNRDKTLKLLIKYIASKQNDGLKPLVTSLKEIDALPNSKEKAIRLIKALLPYRDQLKDEGNQDYLVVFIYYGLKEPAHLSSAAMKQIGAFINQLDTAKEAEVFNTGKCPRNYLIGNINVYPLALKNTFWHKSIDFGTSKEAPILEIRFMGLRGVFKYLLDEMRTKTGSEFKHLDGELIQ
jgi:hypothetical protein